MYVCNCKVRVQCKWLQVNVGQFCIVTGTCESCEISVKFVSCFLLFLFSTVWDRPLPPSAEAVVFRSIAHLPVVGECLLSSYSGDILMNQGTKVIIWLWRLFSSSDVSLSHAVRPTVTSPAQTVLCLCEAGVDGAEIWVAFTQAPYVYRLPSVRSATVMWPLLLPAHDAQAKLPVHSLAYNGVTLERTLSYKKHLSRTAAKLRSRNNLISKLGSQAQLGASLMQAPSAHSIGLCYSIAEYCCPAWSRSSYMPLVDTQLHSSMCLSTGCTQPTQVQWLPVLANIAPLTYAVRQLQTTC